MKIQWLHCIWVRVWRYISILFIIKQNWRHNRMGLVLGFQKILPVLGFFSFSFFNGLIFSAKLLMSVWNLWAIPFQWVVYGSIRNVQRSVIIVCSTTTGGWISWNRSWFLVFTIWVVSPAQFVFENNSWCFLFKLKKKNSEFIWTGSRTESNC